jgi:hypothetical protein
LLNTSKIIKYDRLEKKMNSQCKTKTGDDKVPSSPKRKYEKPKIADEERLITQPLQLACKNPPGQLPPPCSPQTTPIT